MKYKIISICGIGILVTLIYFFYNPEDCALFPKCPFLVLTGWKCPGCGSQRAIHALLNADFRAAIQYNALLVFSIPMIAALLYTEFYKERKPQLYAKWHQTKSTLLYFIIILLWWIGRNVC